MSQDGLSVPAISGGHSEPSRSKQYPPPGVIALQTLLKAGPLTILALGRLANPAAYLKDRTELQGNKAGVLAVMSHQPGHLFQSSEGRGIGAVLGHVPILRDLNVSVDLDAVRSVLTMNLPMTLIPQNAARESKAKVLP